MPVPTGHEQMVRRVTNTPVAASDLNTELATQNGAGFWCGEIKFLDANNAFLLFAKNDTTSYGYLADQHVNAVAGNQAAIDADAATELASGFFPTGIFPSPSGTLFILYSQLNWVAP